MKKTAKRILCMALILACLLAYVPQARAEHIPALPDELFLTQNVTGTCTLCSSAMMIRTSMYLRGNNNWSKVTENALRPSAWMTGVGLYWNFSHTVGNTTVKVGHKNISGITIKDLKALLDDHPEGIVLYCGGLPHAVYLTGYDGDVFYCADTVQGISGKQVTLKKSWLGIMYGSQAAVLKRVTAYWYVTSYMENGQSVGYCDCSRTYAGTYQVTYGSGVNIRAGHGSSYALLGTIPYGTKVTVSKASGAGNGQWAHVTYNGVNGYISMAYLEKVPCEHEYGEWGNSNVEGQEIRTCSICGATESRKREPGKMGTVTGSYVNVRQGAGTNYSVVGQLDEGDRVEVFETKQVGTVLWGRISSGWICMDYVELDAEVTETPIATGTVTGLLNIRAAAGTQNAWVGQLQAGTRLEFYEFKQVGTSQWGRIDRGWVLMDYVRLDSTETPIATGTVISANGGIAWLNVRANAGTGYPQVGRLEIGEKVELLEIKQVGTSQWGRIAQGWVLMDYVKLDGAEEPETMIGTVTGNALRIRNSAGTSGDVVGYYNKGDQVEILETAVVDGVTWGRTDKGWICMDYVDCEN